MIPLKKKLVPIFPLTNEDIVPTIFSFSSDSAKYLYPVPPRNATLLMNKHQKLPRRTEVAADLLTLLPHFKYQVPHNSHLKSTLTSVTGFVFAGKHT